MFDIQINIELKKGNPNAFKEVFRLLYPRLKGYCKLFISNGSLVEDIIQESFITLWEKRDSIKADKSIESFVFVIVRNRCLNVLKKQKIEESNIELDNLNISELQYLYQLDFTEKEDKSMEELLIASFQNAVEKLPEKMKLVFTKCKIEGLKQKDVAQELGISLKMVEKQINKAKLQIRKKLIHQYQPLAIIIVFLFFEYYAQQIL